MGVEEETKITQLDRMSEVIDQNARNGHRNRNGRKKNT